MPQLINSETAKVYPFPPDIDSDDGIALISWRAAVSLIDKGRASYDPVTDSLQLLDG